MFFFIKNGAEVEYLRGKLDRTLRRERERMKRVCKSSLLVELGLLFQCCLCFILSDPCHSKAWCIMEFYQSEKVGTLIMWSFSFVQHTCPPAFCGKLCFGVILNVCKYVLPSDKLSYLLAMFICWALGNEVNQWLFYLWCNLIMWFSSLREELTFIHCACYFHPV